MNRWLEVKGVAYVFGEPADGEGNAKGGALVVWNGVEDLREW